MKAALVGLALLVAGCQTKPEPPPLPASYRECILRAASSQARDSCEEAFPKTRLYTRFGPKTRSCQEYVFDRENRTQRYGLNVEASFQEQELLLVAQHSDPGGPVSSKRFSAKVLLGDIKAWEDQDGDHVFSSLSDCARYVASLPPESKKNEAGGK